ncbi:MAG: hypothetical protein JW843_06010 [Candidatus Aminicenantes bacterium]|nr:hypothetical protein [Candidatus Aminicenantes bacterium]
MSKAKKRIFALAVPAALAVILAAQFNPDEISRDRDWEEFLSKAEMTVEKQMTGPGAVTNPYKMLLEMDGRKRFAAWKNPQGRMGGAMEGWMWEIAAYRLDRWLGLNMVPVTIERRFRENRGSLQLWVEGTFPYLEIMEGRTKMPGGMKGVLLNRQVYLQRAFDDLIYNEDRHANNILITDDWRMILIDHSRSFRTSKASLTTLLYNPKSRTHPGTISALPSAFVEKLKALTPEIVRTIVESYLTKKEIEAVMVRRDLILKEIDRLIALNGKAQVLY